MLVTWSLDQEAVFDVTMTLIDRGVGRFGNRTRSLLSEKRMRNSDNRFQMNVANPIARDASTIIKIRSIKPASSIRLG
jgi:hypothetical protein